MKHKKKFFVKIGSTFFITIFFLSMAIIITPFSSASAIVTLENWDSYIPGAESGSNIYAIWATWSYQGDNEVYFGNYMISSPKSLYYGQGGTGHAGGSKFWYNLSASYDYIGMFSLAFKIKAVTASGYAEHYLRFYNITGSVIHEIRFLQDSDSSVTVQAKDVTGAMHTIKDQISAISTLKNCYLNITHYTENIMNFSFYLDGVTYWYNGTTYMGGIGGINYTTVSRFYMYDYSPNAGDNGLMQFYFDDLIIDTEGIAPPYYGDINYSSYCEGAWGQYLEIADNRYVENDFGFVFNGYIRAVDLKIGVNQRGYTMLSDYEGYVNGLPMGNPDYFVPDNGHYILRWVDENIFINFDYPIFEFKCNHFLPFGGGVYWFQLGVDTSGGGFRHGNNTGVYADGLYNQINIESYGLSMCFYYNTTEGYEGETGDMIYVNLRDSITNTVIPAYNVLVPEAIEGLNNYVLCRVTSDLWQGDMVPFNDNGTYQYLISPIHSNFINGNFYMLNFTNMQGKINGVTVFFNDIHEQFQWYSNQTFSFNLIRSDSNDGYNNKKKNCYLNGEYGACAYFESDKKIYTYGETVRLRYKIPTTKTLVGLGLPTGKWYACLFKDRSWSDFAPSTETAYYKTLCVEDNDWHFFSIQPPSPTDNVDIYEGTIQEPSWWIFYKSLIEIDDPLRFEVYKQGAFIPSGNITSISPTEPMLNQATTISFDCNNDFQLKIKNVLNTGYDAYTSGIKPLATATYVFYPQTFGYFSVELYVYNGLNYTLVDTAFFYTNTTSGGWGDFGTAEFLYIPYRRVIAGFDNINILYHALTNGSLLEIKDSTGATYVASTIVTTTPGVLNLKLPVYAEIGQWNVTLYGNATHYANFYVIAEEGNYVEFLKNVYLDSEVFTVLVMHTKKIALEFYRDDSQQGTNFILQDNEIPIGNIEIPTTNIKPSIGNWKIQMWEINNNIRIKKLAEAECKVIATPKDNTIPGGGIMGFDIIEYIEGLPMPIRYMIGGILTLVITITPFLIMLFASAGSRLEKINLPSTVYLGLFVFGECLSVAIRAFDWWIVALTLIAIILGFALDYMRKHSTVEAE